MRLFAIFLAAAASVFGSTKLEIENTWVRVWRVTLAPHELMAVQDRLPFVVVYMNGDVFYHEAGKIAEENTSGAPIEKVVIELKPNAPKSPPIKLDPVKLDAEHHLVPLENSRVRVLHTILEPHLKAPLHEHPHYVVVYLTELHTTMTMGDGRIVDNPRRPGEIDWRDALQHATENIGQKTAREIQVEIK